MRHAFQHVESINASSGKAPSLGQAMNPFSMEMVRGTKTASTESRISSTWASKSLLGRQCSASEMAAARSTVLRFDGAETTGTSPIALKKDSHNPG
jgi:hypothetical protein